MSATSGLGDQVSSLPGLHKRTMMLYAEISEMQKQVFVIIRKQAIARKEVQHLFDEEIGNISEHWKIMREDRSRLQGEALAVQRGSMVKQAASEEGGGVTLEGWWQQESHYVNQMFNRLMGKRRPVLVRGAVFGVAEVNRRQRRR